MPLSFEWDESKAVSNQLRHGVSFEEAASIFRDSMSVTIYDPDHSSSTEDRFITIGLSARHRILIAVHCDRGNRIRIISARLATRRERNQYEQST